MWLEKDQDKEKLLSFCDSIVERRMGNLSVSASSYPRILQQLFLKYMPDGVKRMVQ